MLQLPAAITAGYRPATAHEVHSWSFGRLTAPRRPAADNWQQQKGTLDDQAIFGPLQGFECACGKYQGERYQGMICDRCGVKLTTEDQRRRRFGHIDLARSIAHPFGEDDSLSAVPVLPAAFTHSHAGDKLATLYDRLVKLHATEAQHHVTACVEQLFGVLAPLVVIAHEWSLQESLTLARGLALERRGERPGDYSCECGYPLAGLDPAVCPGCGKRLRGV
jgi:hypothetical protein